jgi:Uma2 family endonuclease
MATAVTEQRFSPEDLLTMEGGEHFELVDGQLVEKAMGSYSDWVATRLSRRLGTLEDQGFGWVLGSESSYQCFPHDPGKVRRPDVSFILRGRLPDERIPQGHIPIPPDLAVEVVSPNDLFYEVEAKVEEYLAAGVPLVWVISPETNSVQVFPADGAWQRLGPDDTLTAPELLPGFSCPVDDLFGGSPRS